MRKIGSPDQFLNPQFERRVLDVVENQARGFIQRTAASITNINTTGSIVLARKTSTKSVTNTTNETDLFNGEFTVAGGTMENNSLVRISAWGDYLNNSGSSRDLPLFRVKLGSSPTTVINVGPTAGSGNASNSATRRGWKFEIDIMNKGATNSQIVWLGGDFQFVPLVAINSNFNATTGNGALNVVAGVGMYDVYNTSSIDTTADMAVIFTVANSSSVATHETVLTGAVMELI